MFKKQHLLLLLYIVTPLHTSENNNLSNNKKSIIPTLALGLINNRLLSSFTFEKNKPHKKIRTLHDYPIPSADGKYFVQLLNITTSQGIPLAYVTWHLCLGLSKTAILPVYPQDEHHTLHHYLNFDDIHQKERMHVAYDISQKKGFIMIGKKAKGGKKKLFNILSKLPNTFRLPKKKHHRISILQKLIKRHKRPLLYRPSLAFKQRYQVLIPTYKQHRQDRYYDFRTKPWRLYPGMIGIVGAFIKQNEAKEKKQPPTIHEKPLPKNLTNMHCSPSPYELAVLSEHVYIDKDKIKEGNSIILEDGTELKDWKIHKICKDENYPSFQATLYFNSKKNQMVLAYQGTKSFIRDGLGTSLPGIVGNHPSIGQQQLVLDTLNKALQHLQKNNAHLSITGHSLGAWLAQITAFVAKENYPDLAIKTITFDSPGAKEMLDNLNHNLPKVDTTQLDITNYLSHPNFINTLGTHQGTTIYQVVFDKSGEYESHDLLNFIEVFNPKTGDLKEDLSSQQMDSWPTQKNKTLLSLLTGCFIGGTLGRFLVLPLSPPIWQPWITRMSTTIFTPIGGITALLLYRLWIHQHCDEQPEIYSTQKFCRVYGDKYKSTPFQQHILYDRNISERARNFLTKLHTNNQHHSFYQNYLGHQLIWDKEKGLLTTDKDQDIRLLLDRLEMLLHDYGSKAFLQRSAEPVLLDNPLKTPTFFVGREQQKKQIEEAFKRNKTVIQPIIGAKGMGKRQLAQDYIQQHESEYPCIIYIDAKDAQAIRASYQIIAHYLGLLDETKQPNQATSCKEKDNHPVKYTLQLKPSLTLENILHLCLIESSIGLPIIGPMLTFPLLPYHQICSIKNLISRYSKTYIKNLNSTNPKNTNEDIPTKVHHHLQHKRCLYLFNNATNYEAIKTFLPKKGQNHVLVTSPHHPKNNWHDTSPIFLDNFTQEEALALAQQRLSINSLKNKPSLKELIKTFPRHPILFEQLLSILDNPTCTPHQLSNIVEKTNKLIEQTRQKKEDIPIIYDKALTYVVEQQIKYLQKQHGKRALKLLQQLSLLQTQNIPLDLALHLISKNRKKGVKLLEKLQSSSLVQWHNTQALITIHDLIASILTSDKYSLPLADILNIVQRFITYKPSKKHLTNTIMSLPLWLMHAEELFNHLEKAYAKRSPKDSLLMFFNQPINILFKLGFCLIQGHIQLSNFDEALYWTSKLSDITEKELGKKHINTAIMYYTLGMLYQEQGKNIEAKKYYTQAREIFEKKLVQNHPTTIEFMQELKSLEKPYQKKSSC